MKQLARILVRPPQRPSNGAQTIRNKLGQLARLSRANPIPRQYKVVVNWGNPTALPPQVWGSKRKLWDLLVLNKPEAVASAIDKLHVVLLT